MACVMTWGAGTGGGSIHFPAAAEKWQSQVNSIEQDDRPGLFIRSKSRILHRRGFLRPGVPARSKAHPKN